MPNDEKPMTRYSAAWEQFLVGRQRMLAAYAQAKAHSKNLRVQTHHGPAAEALFREWLETFLPKRFGVTSGYIRAQSLQTPWNAHFDVIIYDQLNSPILWIEDSKDKAAAGQFRIIPAEYVYAVLEVKATFNRANVAAAAEKLRQLQPLMVAVDEPAARYPTYLRAGVALGMVFFELLDEAAEDLKPLEIVRNLIDLQRPFYGAVILRADGMHETDTGLVRLVSSQAPIQVSTLPGGLRAVLPMSEWVQVGTSHYAADLTWGDIKFSDFAFDLLALMNGTFDSGRTSSFHSIDLMKFGPIESGGKSGS